MDHSKRVLTQKILFLKLSSVCKFTTHKEAQKGGNVVLGTSSFKYACSTLLVSKQAQHGTVSLALYCKHTWISISKRCLMEPHAQEDAKGELYR